MSLRPFELLLLKVTRAENKSLQKLIFELDKANK